MGLVADKTGQDFRRLKSIQTSLEEDGSWNNFKCRKPQRCLLRAPILHQRSPWNLARAWVLLSTRWTAESDCVSVPLVAKQTRKSVCVRESRRVPSSRGYFDENSLVHRWRSKTKYCQLSIQLDVESFDELRIFVRIQQAYRLFVAVVYCHLQPSLRHQPSD